LTLFVVSAAILFDALDLSITQVGLPSIESDLQLEPATLPWVANAYVLTYGGLLLLGGRAADLVGRRRVFISGLVLFAGMSLVCGLAPTGEVLIAARGLQGVGAALTVPAAVSIIATTFPEGDQRNRALGVFAACASWASPSGSCSVAWSRTCSTGAGSSSSRCRPSRGGAASRAGGGQRPRGTAGAASYDMPGAVASAVGHASPNPP